MTRHIPKGPPPPPGGRPSKPTNYHFHMYGPAAPATPPRGGPSDAPKDAPTGGTAGTRPLYPDPRAPVPHDLRTVGLAPVRRDRPAWVDWLVLFVGAVLGSAIGGALATAFVVWLMVT